MNAPFELQLFRQAVADERVVWSKHALEKMLARGISKTEVFQVILSGTIIQVYEEDKPFRSALILGFANSRPIHVVF